tara:strand:+ start:1270 stop:1749 length:480 start_codon:yes stop_codon:yes gene_type:complete
VACILQWARSSSHSHSACPICRSGQRTYDDEGYEEGELDDNENAYEDEDEDDEDDDASDLTEEEAYAARELHTAVLEREARRSGEEGGDTQLKIWYRALRKHRHKKRAAERKLRAFDDKYAHVHRKRCRLVSRLEHQEDKLDELKQAAFVEFATEVPLR